MPRSLMLVRGTGRCAEWGGSFVREVAGHARDLLSPQITRNVDSGSAAGVDRASEDDAFVRSGGQQA